MYYACGRCAYKILVQNMNERDHYEDPGMDGRMRGCGMDLTSTG
jgi:hypothetical protein